MTWLPTNRARWPVAVLVLLAVQFVAWTEVLLRPVAVSGQSMEPTLRDGDRVLVDLWTYRQRAPRTGEVVWLVAPRPDSPYFVKRVGRTHATSSRSDPDSRPGGTVWVEGDNPADSLDSRQFGELSADKIAGRVLLRYWPLSRLGLIR